YRYRIFQLRVRLKQRPANGAFAAARRRRQDNEDAVRFETDWHWHNFSGAVGSVKVKFLWSPLVRLCRWRFANRQLYRFLNITQIATPMAAAAVSVRKSPNSQLRM